MSDDKNKLGAMFEKAFANRAAKVAEEQKEIPNDSDENVKDDDFEQVKNDEIINNQEDEENEEFEDELFEDDIENDEFEMQEETIEEIADNYQIEDNKETNNQTTMIKIDDLEEYPDQPFKEYSEEKENEMIDSIRVNGIIQDLIVRPLDNGKYQILSGHNRMRCAKKVGLKEVPCKIKMVNDDDAKLMLVDTNLIQRKEFYPSETAKALKIKKDIYKKNNVNSDFFDELSKEQNMSRGNIQRYLRLNYLVPEMMDRVDNKEIPIKVAEYISFLTENEQKELDEILTAKPRKLNEKQVKKMKEESDNNNLNERTFKSILEKVEKENDKEFEIRFTADEVEKYFKNFDNVNEIKEKIISMFEEIIKTTDDLGEYNG